MTKEVAIGHNLSRDQVRSIVSRIESLEDQKAGIAADIKDVYAEAKGAGLDVPALRAIIKERKADAAKLEEQQHWVDVFRVALGMAPKLDGGAE
jgi:uncharacterized protein (UPF0335 family)